MLESYYRPPVIQGSSGGYSSPQGSSDSNFSAMLESSYRPPSIQTSSSGSTGHQGHPSRQQAVAPPGCFKCGDLGHMRRYYPKLRGKAVQQGQQPMISAPTALPPRCGVQTSRGHLRGGVQAGRGQPATTQSGGVHLASAPATFYALPAMPDALASDIVIISIISVCGRDASVLFDPGSTYSYVSSLFSCFLVISPEPLGTPIHLSTHVGDSVVVDRIYRSCVVTFGGFETRADLLLLDIIDFEVILGMDWLSSYHAVLDCHANTVSLAMPGLSSMPPDRYIDFCIDLALGTQPVSIPSYRTATKELKELKEQLEELLTKGFVRPSVSPWGAPVLFVYECLFYFN
ncbi:uncharacterized protein [Nicotiana sylvestris]|uniref:uncharacterized protein n=1 Tax=Nicotiana sylvestris TaxID=4096 RepID=UPI00388CD921